MENKIKAMFVAAAVLSPGATLAQEFSGGATLGFGFSDVTDVSEDINTLTFDVNRARFAGG